jgi:hypothetical protein
MCSQKPLTDARAYSCGGFNDIKITIEITIID